MAQTLVAMSQRGTVNDFRRLADTIVHTFSPTACACCRAPHRQAGFAVLTSPEIPAALVSWAACPIHGTKTADRPQHQMALAQALRTSVDACFGGA